MKNERKRIKWAEKKKKAKHNSVNCDHINRKLTTKYWLLAVIKFLRVFFPFDIVSLITWFSLLILKLNSQFYALQKVFFSFLLDSFIFVSLRFRLLLQIICCCLFFLLLMIIIIVLGLRLPSWKSLVLLCETNFFVVSELRQQLRKHIYTKDRSDGQTDRQKHTITCTIYFFRWPTHAEMNSLTEQAIIIVNAIN